MTAYAIFLFIFIFLLGTIFGSFIGAMTWRMHKQMDWVRGRSECEHCHHQLVAIDLIPIWSYLRLKGRCRYCHKVIGQSAIYLEIFTGLAFLVSALLFPSLLSGAFVSPVEILFLSSKWAYLALLLWLGCLILLIALFIYDLKWRLLPNKLVFPLIALSLGASTCLQLGVFSVSPIDYLIEICLGMLPITGLYGLLYLISHGRWIGLGDVKLGIAIGLLVPWWGGLIVLFMANLLGTLVSLPGLIKHKLTASSAIPFGPCLIVSTYLVFLLGWLFKQLLLVL